MRTRDIEIKIDMYHEYKNAGEVYKNHKEEIKKVIADTYKLFYIGRTEGLLAIEEIAHYDEYKQEEADKYIEYRFLKKLIMLVVDGTSQENIQFALGNCVVNEPDDYKRIVRAIYKNSFLFYTLNWESVLYQIEEIICNIFPDEYYDELKEYISGVINTMYEDTRKQMAEKLPKQLARIDMSKDAELLKYKDGELVDKIEEFTKRFILGHSDKDIQRYLREIDFADLYLILVYGNKELNDKILNNCSSRLQITLMKRAVNKYNSFGYIRYKKEWIENIEKVIDKSNDVCDYLSSSINYLD